MTIEEHVKHWLDSADHDLDTAESMFASAKYDWCLFIGHLVLEKALKALFVARNENKVPPKIHDLVKLAERSSLALSDDQISFFDKVNDFNINARYPEFKQEFYKLCTKEFTTAHFTRIKELYQWLKSQITY